MIHVTHNTLVTQWKCYRMTGISVELNYRPVSISQMPNMFDAIHVQKHVCKSFPNTELGSLKINL